MVVDELRKSVRAIDLAVAAGRKRQSPRTGFVHLFSGDETASDTIPIYENFCFAFALFRQKTAESVLEGKDLVGRLLAFQTADGNFPNYLHEYPRCWDFHLAGKIIPILTHILRDFHSVLDAEFKEKMERALTKARQVPQKPLPAVLKTAQDWFSFLIAAQAEKKEGDHPIPYDPELQLFLGEHGVQERGEPQPVPLEYLLAEKEGFSKRLLRDHPNQIYAALFYPFASSFQEPRPKVLPLFWKGETIHSLVAPNGKVSGNRIIFELSETVEFGRGDLFEVALFTDISPETSLFVEDKKGLVFRLGETVSIQTPALRIDLRFTLLEGEGTFCGHLSRANRPGQIACRGAQLYEAYDWQIGLRTLRRPGPCTIAADLLFREML